MRSVKLSRRLTAVLEYIPDGSIFADIGSDHAYLPCYAVRSGKARAAIAGEVAEGPLQSARNQVEMQGLQEKISVRKGDGLEVISPGEVDCITIAGMGGTLIKKILMEGKEKLYGVKRLILQPNVGADCVRLWLLENGWKLVAEQILEEDGQIYEILVAEPGDPLEPYRGKDRSASILLGPFLMEEKPKAFIKKWRNELNRWRRILENLQSATDSPEINIKKAEFERKIQMVEEVLHDENGERI